jgi:hypothetical protein
MPVANHVAVALIRDYLTHSTVSAETLGKAIDDPETLGEVMVKLAVIAGEALKLCAAETTTATSMLDVIDASLASD